MEKLIKHLGDSVFVRDYKGGKEFRVSNLEEMAHVAQKFIDRNNLNLEIIERNPILKSFTVKEK